MRIPFLSDSNPLPDKVVEEHNKRIANQKEMDVEYRKRQAKQYRKAEKASSRILSKCYKARKREYEEWLVDYIDQGGSITHSYDYPLGRWDWYVVNKGESVNIDEEICGTTAFSLIVPEDADFEENSFSHIKVYYYEDGKAKRNDGAPVATFSDLGDN